MANGKSDAVKLGEIIARAWQDEAFRKNLSAKPREVIEAAGISVPKGATIHILQDTFMERNAVLADKPLPKEQQLDELPVPANLYQVYAHIYTRAHKDPAFKKKFKTDPVGMISSLGIPLPKGMRIKVYEATSADKYFIIPISPATRATDELSVEELEMVAGGKGKGHHHAETSNVNVLVTVNAQSALNVSSGVNVVEVVNAGAALNAAVVADAAVVVAVATII